MTLEKAKPERPIRTHILQTLVPLVLALAIATPACEGGTPIVDNQSGDGGGSDTGAPAVDQTSQQIATCKQGMVNFCQRLFACAGSTSLTDPATVASIESCANQFAATECTPDRVGCGPTQIYHADKDAACVAGFKDWTCAELSAAGDHFPAPPAVCSEVCD